MKTYLVVFGLILFTVIGLTECGVTGGRSGASYSAFTGGKNVGYRHGSYMSGPQNGNRQENKDLKELPRSNGISTWGVISIIMVIIILGFIGYWGIICYPLFFKERNYQIMHASSTNTTPTISGEFEKLGNYSSRSTTPSRSNE